MKGTLARHYYGALAETQGWQIWVTRFKEYRCPDHPMQNHRAASFRITEAAVSQIFMNNCPDKCPCRTLPPLPKRNANE